MALATSVAAALLAPASLGLAPALGCASAPGPQRTIEVDAKALTKVVKRGKVAKISVETYRPAQEDFLNSGQDTPSAIPMQPAGDVPITVGVLTGGGYVYQNIASKTNSEGKRVVKMRLEPYHKPGAAEIRVRAFINHTPQLSAQCVEIQEYGYKEVANAFKVR